MGLFGGKPELVGSVSDTTSAPTYSNPPAPDPAHGDGPDDTRLAQLEERVHRLETVVAQLLQAPPPVATISPGEATLRPDFWGEARTLKQQGSAIQAIKLVRERTGLGLREAKEAVDRL